MNRSRIALAVIAAVSLMSTAASGSAPDGALLVGGGLAGAYVPFVDDGTGVIGGQLFGEWRLERMQTRLIFSTLYSTSRAAGSVVPTLQGGWAYRFTPLYSVGAIAAVGLRFTTGKTYSPSPGTTVSVRDSQALLALVGITPVLINVGNFEFELTAFVGHDAVVFSRSSGQLLVGAYLAASFVLPLRGEL
jgi:hypothetical protein